MRLRSLLIFLGVSLVMCQEAQPAVEYSSGGMRDPFFEVADPLEEAVITEKPAESWVLDGVLWSPRGGRAQINGRSVKAGDFIGNVEVVVIEKKGVRVKRDGKEGYLTKQGIQWT